MKVIFICLSGPVNAGIFMRSSIGITRECAAFITKDNFITPIYFTDSCVNTLILYQPLLGRKKK